MPLSSQSAHFEEPWLQFQTPSVRHLAFSLCSPDILASIPSELNIVHAFELKPQNHWLTHFHHYYQRLVYLDNHPEELEKFLAQLKSTRLGLRFEMLIWFWLLDDAYHPYRLLGHSIQQIDGAVTLGELDFLVLNQESNETEHWEVALKYYLGEGYLSLPQWYGLNRSDTLLRKLNHFTQKQFQFKQVGNHQIDRHFAVMKGQLYLPQSSHENLSLPAWLNQKRRMGFWGTDIPKQQNLHRLKRHEWICPEKENSSMPCKWWTNGLYYQPDKALFYMFRNKPLISSSRYNSFQTLIEQQHFIT
ncbi:DUF1853 family protein [Acinetobacter chinensis]|uniref:DUF1853 family protein n=1 Tax=Acinetobacter chinensis TaxID=2004650 RepID=A0A3B7LXJ1_9GAMM|nr:DUF1853 family protein [Acinetobacter chinensis]AXY57502.1 DUF1853 family protein [Acinetobacter chinensis]